MRHTILIGTLLSCLLSSAAAAVGYGDEKFRLAFDSLFPPATPLCFVRTYDAAHLQAHPLQTVRALQVSHTAAAIAHERAEDAQQEGEKKTPEGAFWHRRLAVAVSFRGERQAHAEIPVCNRVSQDGRIYCHNDACDGADYGIYLKADGKDGLLVWPAGLRLDGGCGSGDDAPIPEFSPGKDDKLLRLQRAPLAQCAPPP